MITHAVKARKGEWLSLSEGFVPHFLNLGLKGKYVFISERKAEKDSLRLRFENDEPLYDLYGVGRQGVATGNKSRPCIRL